MYPLCSRFAFLFCASIGLSACTSGLENDGIGIGCSDHIAHCKDKSSTSTASDFEQPDAYLASSQQGAANTLGKHLEGHARIAAARAEVDAARSQVYASIGDLFPQFKLDASKGTETRENSAVRTHKHYEDVNVKLTQLLWDFGKTNTQIESARLRLAKAELTYFQTEQKVWLEAVSAIVDLNKTRRVYAFARKSEAHIKTQTGLEQARVDAGSGLTTDVLQSKTQLAGAQSRRILAKGKMINAESRFRSIFGTTPPVNLTSYDVSLASKALPLDLDHAIADSYRKNARLRLAAIDETIADKKAGVTARGSLSPRIEAVAENQYSHDKAGASGFQRNSTLKVQLSFPFSLGLTSINTLRADQSSASAASFRVQDAKRGVEEQVRIAWQNLQTARLNASSKRDQAKLANAYLELSRQEQELGNSSAIDVISGETALMNARSDAAASEAEILNAQFKLINAIGMPLREALK